MTLSAIREDVQFQGAEVMKKTAAILATVTLGTVLALGSATVSMAHGGGGGHGGGFGGGHGFGGGFGGGHGGFGGGHAFGGGHGFGGGFGPGFGGHPLFLNHGYGMSHGFVGPFFRQGYGARRFGRHDFGDFWWDDPYWGTDAYWDYGAGGAYCARMYRTYDPRTGTFVGRDGRRHYCP
jgi:hypothetical protein